MARHAREPRRVVPVQALHNWCFKFVILYFAAAVRTVNGEPEYLRGRSSRRLIRLKGFQLALSFKELCDLNPEVKVEIIVMEGDQGPTIVSSAKRLGASTLIMGYHKPCLFWRILGRKGVPDYCIENSDCQVLIVKHVNRRKGEIGGGKMAAHIRAIRHL
eukprot:c23863_g1_i1 orf=130-609(+)